MNTPSSIRVDTASWSEPEFVNAGRFPPGIAAGRRLAFYAEHFDMVEFDSPSCAAPLKKRCASGGPARRRPAFFFSF